MAKYHQKKEISDAVEYALDNGFVIRPAGRSSHIAFKLYCPESSREGCKIPVYSTPGCPVTMPISSAGGSTSAS